MIDDWQPRFIEDRRQMFFGDRHANSHGKSLTKRTGRRFHTNCDAVFRVAWRQ